MAEHDKLESLLNPTSVAVLGASADPAKGSSRWLRHLVAHKFPKPLYVINPKYKEISGIPCFPSLADLAQPAGLAILLLPASKIVDAVEEGIRSGVRNFIVNASGFAEQDEEGRLEQLRLTDLAATHGVSILGPNCNGAINCHASMCATSASVAANLVMRPGILSFASQSGGMAAYWLEKVIRSGMGFNKWVAVGNEADISIADAIEHFVVDPQTEIIGLYLESARSGNALHNALRKAALAGKPVLAVRAGRSPEGAIAARSHTAAVAAEDAVWRGLFEQYGVNTFASITDLISAAHFENRWPGRPMRRPLVVSVSGGAATLATDHLSEAGFPVMDLPDQLRERLAEVLPDFGSARNPLDATNAIIQDPSILTRIATVAATADEYDGIVVLLGLLYGLADKLIEALKPIFKGDKAVCVVWMSARPDIIDKIYQLGYPCFDDIPPAVKAIADHRALADNRAKQRRRTSQPAFQASLPRFSGSQLSELQSIETLGRDFPLQFARYEVVRDQSDTSCWPDNLPAVAKLQSAALPHKTEYGAVILNLNTRSQLDGAVSKLFDLARTLNIDSEGVLVQEMVRYNYELIVGLRYDEVFGPILMVGRGGTNIEIERDFAIRLLPVSAEQIADMINSLRFATVLKGLRGKPRVDVAALSSLLEKMCGVFQTRTDLAEIEINPLAVVGADQFIGLDCLVRLASSLNASP